MTTPLSTPKSSSLEDTNSDHPSISKAANDLRVAAGEKAREFVHTAEAKAADLKDRALESAQQFRDIATEKAATLKASATERAQQFKDSATEQWQETREKAHELHVTAEDYIRQNPTKCVLSALGIGLLIGLLSRR